MFAYLAIGIGLVAYFRLRGIDNQRSWLLTAWNGLFLGCTLFLCSMFSWFAAEIASRGRSGEEVLWPARMGLAYFYGAVLLLLLMRCKSVIATVVQYVILVLIGIPLAAGLTYSMGIAGPADASGYALPSESKYRLPWKPGATHTCTQGNLSVLSHGGWQEYAYDFLMPVGTEVCAAREGTVVKIVDEHDENGFDAPGNFLVVVHTTAATRRRAHSKADGVELVSCQTG